ncbi:MAG: ATP-binding cassette domain-containing protein, partial [Cumulibacter sp.]
MNSVVDVAGVTIRSRAHTTILDGVDLSVSPGQVVGLVGPSGAGKSTLAMSLLGHLGSGMYRDGGHIRVGGIDPFTPGSQRKLRGRFVSYLSQDPASALDPMRKVGRQLLAAARIAHPRHPRSTHLDGLRNAVKAASLEPELLDRYPTQLSGGQAQRAVLAWVFIVRPQLLVLDEPTSGLDPETARRVSTGFATLPWEPALLLISHDPDLVARVSDRIVRIDGGRLRESGATNGSPATSETFGSNRRAPATLTTGAHHSAAKRAFDMASVTIRRGDRVLLREATLRIDSGEIVALRGRSGTGKTSLARALCGLAPPAEGRLLVHNVEVP